MGIYDDLIPKVKQPSNAQSQASSSSQQKVTPQTSSNSFSDLIPVKTTPSVTPTTQPTFLQNLGTGIKNVASQIGQGAQNLFSDLVPKVAPVQPVTPAPKAPAIQPGQPDLSVTPTANASAIQPNTLENRQKVQQVIDSFTNTDKTLSNIFPQTAQTLKELNIDPLNLKANPKKAIADAGNTIIDSINNMPQAAQALTAAFRSGNGAQIASASAKGVSSIAGVALSPISALFSAANDVPIIGTLTKLLMLPILTPAGDLGKSGVNAFIDKLPTTQANKTILKAGFGDIGSLVAQMIAGGVTEVGAAKMGTLEAKYGTDGAKTIANTAETVVQQAAQNKTIPKKVVLPPETVAQIATHPDMAKTPAAETLQNFVDQATRSKENVVNARQQQTPQHIEITQGDAVKPGFVTTQAPNGTPFSVKLVDAPKTEPTTPDTTPPTTRQIIKLDKTKYTGMQGGSVIVRPSGIASLDLHFVKEARGQGQGTRAVSELEQIARDKGMKKVEIAAFTEAKGFWEKQGYTEMKNATPTKSSLLVKMEKTLNPNQTFVGMEKNLEKPISETKLYHQTNSADQIIKNGFIRKQGMPDGGFSLTTDKNIAQSYRAGNGDTIEVKLKPDAKIAKLPPRYENNVDAYLNIAKKQGYDAVDMRNAKEEAFKGQSEIRLLNSKAVEKINKSTEIVTKDFTTQPKTEPKILKGNEVNAIRSTIQDKLQQVRETSNTAEDLGKGIDQVVKSTTDKAGNDKRVLSALRSELAKELNTIGGGGNYKDQFHALQIIKKEDPEMGPIVQKLEGHIVSLDDKLLTSKKELTPTIREPLAPIGTGETTTSKLALGVEEKAVEAKLTRSIAKLPEYNKLNMKDQARDAVKFLNENPDKAKQIAMGVGEAPAHITPEAIFTAVENRALESKDIATIRELARSQLTTEATAMGQRIRTLGERDPNSPVAIMKDIIKAREQKVVKDTGQSLAKKTEGTIKEIKAKVPKVDKYDWGKFLESIQC